MSALKIISWNINGIRAIKQKGLDGFLANYQPDVLGLQEIKISDSARLATDFDFSGWQEYWYSAERPGYSGTATLSRLLPETCSLGVGEPDFDREGRVQTLAFADFYFVNIYFPNAGPELARLSYKEKFNQTVLTYLKKIQKIKPVIVGGDYNVAHRPIDLARPQANEGQAGYTESERRAMDNFHQAGLVDSFRYLHPQTVKYSWWSYRGGARRRNVGWRIDYLLLSQSLLPRLRQAFILDEVLGSDHAPVGIVLADK